jgi:16S rRNA (guanine527-N7)-methyltransferase
MTAANAAPPQTAALQTAALQLGVTLSAEQTTALLDYMALIQKWTKVYNLTAVRNPNEMLTHHLLDSLAVVVPLRRYIDSRGAEQTASPAESSAPPLAPPSAPIGSAQPIRVLDVGSGAGLPGVVLAVICPELDVTCVDTVAKKAAFIQQAAVTLRLPNLRGVHARVEELNATPFDIVTSRAFASLLDFVSLTKFHVKQPKGGVWMAMKGKHPGDEIAALPADVAVFHVEPLNVPGLGAERCLVWIRPGS